MKNKIIGILAIGLLGYWVIGLSGCAGVSKKDRVPTNEALLEPQAMLKFSDVPIPVAFKSLTQDSYTFESAGIRVGILKYQGKADVEQVVNFYKDQMPLYNWNLLNVIEYGERLLNFEREQETCIIRILPKGNNITLTIALGPKAGPKPKKVDKSLIK
jgi:hypothetical protein